MKSIIISYVILFLLSINIFASPGYDIGGTGGMDIATYDADSNGIVDDVDDIIKVEELTSESIIDALASCSVGSAIFMPAGTYVWDSTYPIRMPCDNCTLFGDGKNTIIDASAWSDDHVIDLNGKDYINLRDFKIIGYDGGGNTKDLIYTNADSDYCTIDNLTLLDSDSYAIKIDNTGAYYNTIKNCFIDNPDDGGIFFRGRYGLITNNHCLNADNYYGIIAYDYHHIISNNICTDNGYEGIYASASNTVINGNRCLDNRRGIYSSGVRNSIVGNNISSNDQHGIEVQGDYTAFVGNVSQGEANNYDSFRFQNADYCTITGNTSEGNNLAEYAIRLLSCDYNTISGNTGVTHGTGGILEDSSCIRNNIYGNNMESELTPYALSGSSTSYISSQNGNMAIGTTTYSSKLVVYGTITAMGLVDFSDFDDKIDALTILDNIKSEINTTKVDHESLGDLKVIMPSYTKAYRHKITSEIINTVPIKETVDGVIIDDAYEEINIKHDNVRRDVFKNIQYNTRAIQQLLDRIEMIEGVMIEK